MKRPTKITFVLCLALLLAKAAAFAESAPWQDFEQSGNAAILAFPEKSPRSSSHFSFLIDQNHFEIKKSGHGAFHRFQNVNWSVEASGKIQDNFLRQEASLCVIKDADDTLLYRAQKTFDYEKNKIFITIREAKDQKKFHEKKYVYPLKGYTIDEPCLIHFIKAFIPHLNEKEYRYFYLITFEPALYKVLVKPQGQESVELGGKKYDCVKIRLIADMGILDNIFDKYVPATFVWYDHAYPYTWIQYQGLEAGKHSANILTYIEE